MHSGDALMEDQGVGHDGAGHAAGLGDVGHPQQAGYVRGDGGARLADLVQMLGGSVDTLLQDGGGLVYGALGYGDKPHHVGYVLHGAVQPARFREPANAAFGLLCEDTIGKLCFFEVGPQVVGLPERLWVAESNYSFDYAPVYRCFQPEAVFGFLFNVGRWYKLRLDYYRRAACSCNEYVRLQSCMSGDCLCVFRMHPASAHHGLEQAAKGVVGAGFGLSGHTSQWTWRFVLKWRRAFPNRSRSSQLAFPRPQYTPASSPTQMFFVITKRWRSAAVGQAGVILVRAQNDGRAPRIR